jgi:hypothetical protein
MFQLFHIICEKMSVAFSFSCLQHSGQLYVSLATYMNDYNSIETD